MYMKHNICTEFAYLTIKFNVQMIFGYKAVVHRFLQDNYCLRHVSITITLYLYVEPKT